MGTGCCMGRGCGVGIGCRVGTGCCVGRDCCAGITAGWGTGEGLRSAVGHPCPPVTLLLMSPLPSEYSSHSSFCVFGTRSAFCTNLH